MEALPPPLRPGLPPKKTEIHRMRKLRIHPNPSTKQPNQLASSCRLAARPDLVTVVDELLVATTRGYWQRLPVTSRRPVRPKHLSPSVASRPGGRFFIKSLFDNDHKWSIICVYHPDRGFLLDYINSMGLGDYIAETKVEMKHVTWPTRKQAVAFTVIVILLSVAVAFFLGFFDYLFVNVLKKFF